MTGVTMPHSVRGDARASTSTNNRNDSHHHHRYDINTGQHSGPIVDIANRNYTPNNNNTAATTTATTTVTSTTKKNTPGPSPMLVSWSLANERSKITVAEILLNSAPSKPDSEH